MAIRSKEKFKRFDPDFPKLMISNTGCVVLFKQPSKGTIVAISHNSPPYRVVGDYSEDFDMAYFQNYFGTIELVNDVGQA